MPLIGAHVSAAGGLHNCFKNASDIGAQALQIFVSSPRAFQVRVPTDEIVAQFKQAQKETKLGPVFAHAAYLVNLASADKKTQNAGIQSLVAHLSICETLGIVGLVFHLGSIAKGGTKEEGVARTAEAMNKVLEKVPGKSFLIMENSSGGGGKLGNTPEEIGEMFRLANNPRIKVCLDTAHAFAANELGETVTDKTVDSFVSRCDKSFGWKNVVCIHFNDSKVAAGTFTDRHENIGEGLIGIKGLKAVATHPMMKDLPLIMEVPGFGDDGSDVENVKRLKKICGTK
jgi:deoxyribonuclease-4